MSHACSRSWSYHVLVAVEGDAFLSRLHAMGMWLDQWNMPYRIVSVPRDEDVIQVCFSEAKYARAFQRKFGARSVPADVFATAQAENAEKIESYELVAEK